MRLDVFLHENSLVSSRTKAKEIIRAGRVSVDGITIEKPAFEVNALTSKIEVKPSENQEYVGRGGIKLEYALDTFSIQPSGKICVDIGASTGGFTDCLLKRGAAVVYAIDSGTNQLSRSLRNNPRVVSLENTNARYIDRTVIGGNFADLVVMDVSFISQKLLYPSISTISRSGTDIVTLIKPQFEAGKEHLDKHGVVKSESGRKKVIEDIISCSASFGFEYKGLTESPIKGGTGNTEYLIYLKKL